MKTAAGSNTPQENEELLKMFEDGQKSDHGRVTAKRNIEWTASKFEDWGRNGLSVADIAIELGAVPNTVIYQLKKEKFADAYQKGRNSRKTAAESRIES